MHVSLSLADFSVDILGLRHQLLITLGIEAVWQNERELGEFPKLEPN